MNIESFAKDLLALVAENADLCRKLAEAEHYKEMYWDEVRLTLNKVSRP